MDGKNDQIWTQSGTNGTAYPQYYEGPFPGVNV
jgi:hypothetical protein